MKKTNALRLPALLLAACLLIGCGAKAPPEEKALPTPSPAVETAVPVMAEESAAADDWNDGVHADVHYDDMHWEMGDLTAFRAISDRLSAAESGDEAAELYGQLLEEYNRLRTWSELAWIEMYASGGKDSALSDACQKLDDLLTEAGDTLFTARSGAPPARGWPPAWERIWPGSWRNTSQ